MGALVGGTVGIWPMQLLQAIWSIYNQSNGCVCFLVRIRHIPQLVLSSTMVVPCDR